MGFIKDKIKSFFNKSSSNDYEDEPDNVEYFCTYSRKGQPTTTQSRLSYDVKEQLMYPENYKDYHYPTYNIKVSLMSDTHELEIYEYTEVENEICNVRIEDYLGWSSDCGGFYDEPPKVVQTDTTTYTEIKDKHFTTYGSRFNYDPSVPKAHIQAILEFINKFHKYKGGSTNALKYIVDSLPSTVFSQSVYELLLDKTKTMFENQYLTLVSQYSKEETDNMIKEQFTPIKSTINNKRKAFTDQVTRYLDSEMEKDLLKQAELNRKQRQKQDASNLFEKM